MTRAYLNTDLNSMAAWIDDWAQNRRISRRNIESNYNSSYAVSASQPFILKATTRYYSIIWQINTTGNRTQVTMTTRLRLHLSLLLNSALLVSLFAVIIQIAPLVQSFALTNLFYLILSAGFTVFFIRCKYHHLCSKLIAFEKHFWHEAERLFDTEFMTRHEGYVEPSLLRFIVELLMAVSIIIIGYLVGGAIGVVISILLLAPFVTVLLVYLWKNTHPQWHWHLWIIGNMNRWIFLVFCIPALATVLFAIEAFLPLGLYKTNTVIPITSALKDVRFRRILPPSAFELEADAMAYIMDISQSSVKENPDDYQSYLYFYSISILFIISLAVLFFSCIPFISLMASQKQWRHQAVNISSIQSPSVPYLANSWNLKYPLALRILIVFHWAFGGILNIAAVVFSVDSINYILFGKCYLLPEIANLWSWVFAAARLAFGDARGKTIVTLLVIAPCLPVLFLLSAFVRRALNSIFRAFRTITLPCRQSNALSELNHYVIHTCKSQNMKTPAIRLVSGKSANICLYYAPFINRSIIEISKGTLDLLSPEELKAAVLHEIGHLKQGPWRVALLKMLSSLAFFPNYYLTLSINWAKKEMDADRFALKTANDAQSLKQALIKMSVVSTFYSAQTMKAGISHRWFGRFFTAIRRRIRGIGISFDFFFGDGLFGYAHPYLSERLAVIDGYCNRE